MYYSTRVLLLFVMQVVLVHCFPPWDIVVGTENRLEFYYNGTLTHTEHIPSASYINSVTYDPVHYRVLYAADVKMNICISSFDLLTRKIQPLLTKKSNVNRVRVTYDPVTQLLFWAQKPSIYSFSLNPAVSNKALDGNTLVTLRDECWDIAVDSCGGYIYWATYWQIERIQFDGSKREVLIQRQVWTRRSLAIDQQTQRMYWIDEIGMSDDYHVDIQSADLNGKNRTTLHKIIFDHRAAIGTSLAISKDFIYWRGQKKIWQLPKNLGQHEEPKSFPISVDSNMEYQIVAANYTIEEQTEGNANCKTLMSLIPIAFVCLNYCLQGNCSVSAEGPPLCRCNAGYSGERCEVYACHMYCLNNGECSLNEEDKPVCKCSAGYEGVRCELAAIQIDDMTRNMLWMMSNRILRDTRYDLRQAIQQELQRGRCSSDKIDE